MMAEGIKQTSLASGFLFLFRLLSRSLPLTVLPTFSKITRASHALLLAVAFATAVKSQTGGAIEFPAASPAAMLLQRVGLTDIEVVYSRPSVRDRQIFGGLQP